jgi:phage terminase large subunit
MVAGFGAGKTNALIHRALYLKFKYPTCNVAYYLPTYDLVRTIAFPRFEEVLGEEFGMIEGTDYKCVRSLTPMILFPDGGHIIMRTMDNPGRIVGYEVADSLIDELDTLKTEDASAVWKKIIARNRQKKPDGSKNTIAVGTTPEGFRFVYEQWKRKPPSAEYYLIKATTYSNGKNLPDGYIQDLIDTYPPAFIAAYLNGDFVNLTSGTVYGQYDRLENSSA